jgi:spermidine synthase
MNNLSSKYLIDKQECSSYIPAVKKPRHIIIFLMFIVSGFCGLLYQIIWMRLAFAAFGVVTPVLSVVISVFMAGLAAGSWAGGRWIDAWSRRSGVPAIGFYGLAEVIIGIGGLSVPLIFAAGERMLLSFGSMESIPYLAASAGILAFSILPWCIFMGVTFPFMMAFIHEIEPEEQTAFSFLYLANVIGGMIGTILTAVVLIEWIGLRHCLILAALLNFAIAILAFVIAGDTSRNSLAPKAASGFVETVPVTPPDAGKRLIPYVLFMTGFSSMAMEVVWTRLFTPVLRTTIYSFAALLAVYLGTTWIGSLKYRQSLARGTTIQTGVLLGWLTMAALLPLLANDPRLAIALGTLAVKKNVDLILISRFRIALVLASIVPFCMLLGYLLPRLIDGYAGGVPRAAGRAYAINIIGCILGPLVAAYLLLPLLGVKFSLILLGLPFVVFAGIEGLSIDAHRHLRPSSAMAAAALIIIAGLFCRTYEDGTFFGPSEVRRDHVATTTAYGFDLKKGLLVNGIGMTTLTPITKFMAHFPLALLNRPQPSVLVICFGMGTTYRSALTWDNTDVTAIELVPGVRDVFGFFFADANRYLSHPRGSVLIDDGRRFLRRTPRQYDLITIDPPPPVEAAGSSLLYSREFLKIVREHLREGGILQHWLPGTEEDTVHAVAQSLVKEFRHVKVFQSVTGWGFHFTASMQPINLPTAAMLASAVPAGARRDLLEWNPEFDPAGYLNRLLVNEVNISDMLPGDPRIEITDDRPYNEYFLVRRSLKMIRGTYSEVY